jgi:hypothetical protein
MLPLRKKVIHEEAFARYFDLLEEMSELLIDERSIDKSLAANVFLVYSQLIAQSNYVYDKSPFIPIIDKLQGHIRKIFGGGLQTAKGGTIRPWSNVRCGGE